MKQWAEAVRAKELAEKRRVAPGWLDVNTRMLLPTKKDGTQDSKREEAQSDTERSRAEEEEEDEVNKEGEELDRAFGNLGLG